MPTAMPLRHAIPVLVAALLTGCGEEAQEPARPAERVTDPDVAALVERCGVSADVAEDGAVVPAELRPAPAQVAAASSTDSGYEARVIYARPLREVMNDIVAKARSAGHEVTFTEFEGSDGEIGLRRGGAETELRLLAVRRCPSVSQAAITSVEE
jgi:hypothetical protein